jgi:hypothetical protein
VFLQSTTVNSNSSRVEEDCSKYTHRRIAAGALVWHVEQPSGKKISLCTRKDGEEDEKEGEESRTLNHRDRGQWRKSWLYGDDVVARVIRRRGRRKVGPQLKRKHAFTEECDCVSCVAMACELKTMGEGTMKD